MREKLLLLIVLLTAFLLRFNGLNWDANFHLHPDERFLTMVGNAVKIPASFVQYLDPTTSPLNPANNEFGFFVYGTFPMVLNKILAVWGDTDTYNAFTLQGRALSAIFDLGALIFVYKIGRALDKSKEKLLGVVAAFFYAVAVLPIQLSHYFAVDTFLNFFVVGSFFFSLREYKESHFKNIILSAIFLGLAVACKINALFVLPLNLLLIYWKPLENFRKVNLAQWFMKNAGIFLGFIVLSYFVLRIAAPYYFETGNILDPRLGTNFVASINSLKSFEGKDVWYPPAIQWINKEPVTFSLINLAMMGVGLPYFIFILVGFFVPLLSKKQERILKLPYVLMIIWALGIFLYQSTQFVKAMRYFIYIYPFLAVFAGYGFISLINFIKARNVIRYTLYVIFIVAVLVWPLAFSSVYVNPHSRVTASEWIYKNVPTNSIILSEHWDDGLPLPMELNYGKQYTYEQLPVFDPDYTPKWDKMSTLLTQGDYYMLTSNRGWGSIPTVPEKYPLMTKFYRDLLDGQTGYIKVAEFTSYPSLRYLGIPWDFPTDWVDESFTVYDHPVVMIYRNSK